jgi:TonB family protein
MLTQQPLFSRRIFTFVLAIHIVFSLMALLWLSSGFKKKVITPNRMTTVRIFVKTFSPENMRKEALKKHNSPEKWIDKKYKKLAAAMVKINTFEPKKNEIRKNDNSIDTSKKTESNDQKSLRLAIPQANNLFEINESEDNRNAAQSSGESLNNIAPDYPSLSRKLGEQGSVVVRVLVGIDGLPIQLVLHISSGFHRLDQAAMDAAERWHYIPAKHNGQLVDAWLKVPFSFVLDDSA